MLFLNYNYQVESQFSLNGEKNLSTTSVHINIAIALT